MSTGRKKKERISPVHPASREREWKIRAFDAASRLIEALAASRDHRETAAVLMQSVSDGLGIRTQAVYLDEDGGGMLRLLHGGRVEEGLPAKLAAGSALVRHFSGGSSPVRVSSFFDGASELTGSELEVRDAFEQAGIDAAVALKFGGETAGLYVFASGDCRGGSGIALESAGVLAAMAASKIGCQLISDEGFSSAHSRERLRRRELRAVMNAVIDRTAAEIETVLGVLKSGLWSIDIDRPADADGGLDTGGGGDVMMSMARDAAARLEAKVSELAAIGRLDTSDDEPELEEIDMADVVEDVTRDMIAEFEKKGIAVSIEDRAIGKTFHAEAGMTAYIVRSVIEHVLQSSARDTAIEIYWAVSDEGPEGEDGLWMVLRVRGAGSPGPEDGIDSILDSIEAEYSRDAGPPPDSALTLSAFITESSGGALIREEGGEGVSVYFPM